MMITRKLRNALNNRLTATASAIGDPAIVANAVVQFNGVGPDFSGNYRITGATHVIDSNGYRTNFKVRKEIIP
jgi:phage protein D